MKIIDIFLTIDHNPFVLKGPLLPYSFNSYRIPLFINNSWWYPTKDFEVESILINGGRFPYWESSPAAQLAPPQGRYTIHEQPGIGKFICINFDITTLWRNV